MDQLKNFAYSTVATAPSPATSGTSLVAGSGEGARFATPPFNAVLWPAGAIPQPNNAEIVRVTGIASDTLTIVRAQEGSTARTVVVGDQIMGALTNKAWTDLQAAMSASLQPGAMLSGDAAMTVNSSNQVTVAAASQFWVTNAAGVLLPVSIVSTAISLIPAAGTYTRLDQIVVDSTGYVSRLAGGESSGVTLANRTGAAGIPAGSRLLYDILVTTAGVLVANVRDRRPWARGAFSHQSSSSDYTASPTVLTAIDSTNLSARLECSGVPLRIRVLASRIETNAAGTPGLALYVDGGQQGGTVYQPTLASGNYDSAAAEFFYVPSAGSHLFVPYWVTTGTPTLTLKGSLSPVRFIVEEIVRANTNNGTS